MISRRRLLTVMGAAPAAWPLMAAGQSEERAVALIKTFYDRLQSVMTGAQVSDPKQHLAALSDVVKDTFDLGAMARLAVGPRWASIPAAKRASLQDAFGRYFVATFASRLGQAAGGRFEVLPKTERRGGRILVRTRIVDAGGKTTPVDYLVTPGGRVLDVYLGGTVSELASHRSEFEAALKAGGPDALEARLRERADELMGTR